MRNWNKFEKKIPPYETFLEVMNLSGETDVASLIYLDDINRYVWKHEDTYRLFDTDYYPYWRMPKHKASMLKPIIEKIHCSGTPLVNKFKHLFKKEKENWVLTCFTEDNDIFFQGIYDTYEEAYCIMKKQYDEVLDRLGDYVHENHLFPTSATIVYDDDPCVFEYSIKCIKK